MNTDNGDSERILGAGSIVHRKLTLLISETFGSIPKSVFIRVHPWFSFPDALL